MAHGDGRFSKLMAGFAKTELIILDDWGLAKFTAEQRRDLLELLDDRHGNRSTLVTSQVPVDHWYEVIAEPTLGDAILTGSCTTLTGSTCKASPCENLTRN